MEKILIVKRGKELLQIGPEEFRDFISRFVKERAYLSVQKTPTLAQERKWLKEQAEGVDNGDILHILLMDGKKVAGNCTAHKAKPKNEGQNVHFGLAVAPKYRGKGWGEKLLRLCIKEAKKKLKPKKMWIEHVDGNKTAHKLYERCGFVEVARLALYINHYGEWKDKVLMEYRGK